MEIGFLETLKGFISSLGFDPATTVIAAALLLSVVPAARAGRLDNNIDSLLESLDYGLVILSTGFLLAFYFQFGINGVKNELLGITGGFVLGTLTVRTLSKITGMRN